MPDLDLPPGDYRERKPKGWRWKLPWASPEGAKLPAALCAVESVFVVYLVTRAPGLEVYLLGGAALGAGIGATLMLALRD